jgi:hypothetical protein
MPRTQPPYLPEFRREAIRLLRSGERSPKQLAQVPSSRGSSKTPRR